MSRAYYDRPEGTKTVNVKAMTYVPGAAGMREGEGIYFDQQDFADIIRPTTGMQAGQTNEVDASTFTHIQDVFNHPYCQIGSIGVNLATCLAKGQYFNNEKKNEISQRSNFFNYTYFPVVYNLEGVPVVAPFAACYSATEPSRAGVGHPAQFIPYNCVGTGHVVNVDISTIADSNCQKSVMSAIEFTRPNPGSYIWFMRAFNLHHGKQGITTPPKIRGASLGLALAACIMGGPSIMYTGFIRRMPQGYFAQWEGGVSSFKLNPQIDQQGNPINVGNAVQLTDADGNKNDAWNVDDIVEDVDMIPAKMIAAATVFKIPLVVPHKSSYNGSIAKWLATVSQRRSDGRPISSNEEFYGTTLVQSVIGRFYSTSKADQGIPLDINKVSTLLATSLPEALQLACIAWPMYADLKFNMPESEYGSDLTRSWVDKPLHLLEERHRRAVGQSKLGRAILRTAPDSAERRSAVDALYRDRAVRKQGRDAIANKAKSGRDARTAVKKTAAQKRVSDKAAAAKSKLLSAKQVTRQPTAQKRQRQLSATRSIKLSGTEAKKRGPGAGKTTRLGEVVTVRHASGTPEYVSRTKDLAPRFIPADAQDRGRATYGYVPVGVPQKRSTNPEEDTSSASKYRRGEQGAAYEGEPEGAAITSLFDGAGDEL